MKKLYLIRHAKSNWDDPDLADFDRPLNERGQRDAPRMAKRLREKRITPDLVLTSPAKRTFDTCREMCSAMVFPISKVSKIDSLYHASAEQILMVVQQLPERVGDDEENVLLFGHNPGLTEFANLLLNEHIPNIPTAGIVAAHLKIEKWKDAKWRCGSLLFFDFPKNTKE